MTLLWVDGSAICILSVPMMLPVRGFDKGTARRRTYPLRAPKKALPPATKGRNQHFALPHHPSRSERVFLDVVRFHPWSWTLTPRTVSGAFHSERPRMSVSGLFPSWLTHRKRWPARIAGRRGPLTCGFREAIRTKVTPQATDTQHGHQQSRSPACDFSRSGTANAVY